MKLHFTVALLALTLVMGCSNKDAQASKPAAQDKAKTEAVKPQARIIHESGFDAKKSFIVISKKDLCLSVYAPINGDTTLLARFPACLSKNKGNKQRKLRLSSLPEDVSTTCSVIYAGAISSSATSG